MLRPPQEVGLAPQEEVVQRDLRIDVDADEVFVRPNLQTHQHDSDVQRSIELQAEEEETFFLERVSRRV